LREYTYGGKENIAKKGKKGGRDGKGEKRTESDLVPRGYRGLERDIGGGERGVWGLSKTQYKKLKRQTKGDIIRENNVIIG